MMRLTNGMSVFEGTQFEGSLHPGDVGTELAGMVDYFANTAYHDLLERYADLYRAQGDRDDSFWDSELGDACIDEMFEALDALSPAGYYFGSHPYDGADFGWWASEDM